MFNVQCSMFNVQCSMFNVQCLNRSKNLLHNYFIKKPADFAGYHNSHLLNLHSPVHHKL